MSFPGSEYEEVTVREFTDSETSDYWIHRWSDRPGLPTNHVEYYVKRCPVVLPTENGTVILALFKNGSTRTLYRMGGEWIWVATGQRFAPSELVAQVKSFTVTSKPVKDCE